jgi:carbohydrate-selective porin OprB
VRTEKRGPFRSAGAIALRGAALGAWLTLAAPPGGAAADGAAETLARHLRETPLLLGDPAGGRSWLEERGLALDLFWNHQIGLLLRDGSRGNLAESGSVDLFLRADLGRLGLPFGGEVLAQVKSNYNRNVNDLAGALGEPIDDADFDSAIWVDQIWYERAFPAARLRVRAGYLDEQVAFDRNAYANNEDKQFLNTFLDNDPVVPLEIGLGAMAVLAPTGWLELAFSVADADAPLRRAEFDTAFDGADSWTSYAEATVRGAIWRGLPGTLRVGVTRDGADLPVFGRHGSTRGRLSAYLSADQRLYAEAAGGDQGLGFFARAGVTDGRVSRIERFWSAGLQYDGLLPRRAKDVLGLAFYQTVPSDRYRADVDPSFGRETGVELYYRIWVTPWLALTPDLQWIHAPGGHAALPDDWVLVLRFRVVL